MSTRSLTTSSFIVLGLIEFLEPATAYDVKRISEAGTMKFWSLPHTQLYTECARLAADGYLEEQQEQTGRRRRVYRLTPAGRDALQTWRQEPPEEVEETRDPAILKLFFGADPSNIAPRQVEIHAQQLKAYQDLAARAGDDPRQGRRIALDFGLAYEQMALDFWVRVQHGVVVDQAADEKACSRVEEGMQ